MIAHDPTPLPAYGPFGPIARTGLMDPEGFCPRWLLSDGRGTTSGSADNAGNIQIQHFDAFGVALETATISTCPMPECATCERGRRATGELGYHGQEGYRTRHYDANRGTDLPNKSPDHPEYDENYQEGYETPSTGFIQVGARDYDPAIGRWLEVDPAAVGPEMRTGQLNRWAYCANDPVNLCDPTGEVGLVGFIIILIVITLLIIAAFKWWSWYGASAQSARRCAELQPDPAAVQFMQDLQRTLPGVLPPGTSLTGRPSIPTSPASQTTWLINFILKQIEKDGLGEMY